MDRCYGRPTLNYMWVVREFILQDNGGVILSAIICNELRSIQSAHAGLHLSAGATACAGWRVQESSSKVRNLKFSMVKVSKVFDSKKGSCKRGQIISDFLTSSCLKISPSFVRATRRSNCGKEL